MGKFGKVWWVFAIISMTAALLNPYVGIFGLVILGEMFILFCLDINITVRLRVLKKHTELKLTKQATKALIVAAYIIPVIFFFITVVVSLGVFIVAYKDKAIAAPYQIWSNPDQMSIVFLIVEMIFNVLLLISFICRGKTLRKLVKEYD